MGCIAWMKVAGSGQALVKAPRTRQVAMPARMPIWGATRHAALWHDAGHDLFRQAAEQLIEAHHGADFEKSGPSCVAISRASHGLPRPK